MKTAILLILCLLEGILGQTCTDGAIRLVGGREPGEGRLELCRSGVWGTVCNEGWELVDARVACSELFQGINLNSVVASAYFDGAASSQSVHIRNVSCIGNESRLVNCMSEGVVAGSTCGHDRDVGLICTVAQPECNASDVRLVGGPTSDEGRVEYCAGGMWGQVCISNNMWRIDQVNVVCGQLGLFSASVFVPMPSLFGPDSGGLLTYGADQTGSPFVLSDVSCTGAESQLSQCNSAPTISRCIPFRGVSFVGAICSCPNENELRFAVGSAENDGRVEICINGVWRTFCETSVDLSDTVVICRELGYAPIAGFIPEELAAFSRPLLPMGPLNDRSGFDPRTLAYLFDFQCIGNESRLTDCRKTVTSPCTQSGPAGVGVRCPTNATVAAAICTFGDIRLLDGVISPQVGRVEVCANGQWGLVCENMWDEMDATVACRQLGYQGRGIPLRMPTFFGTSSSTFLLDELMCNGNEQNLFDCRHAGITVHDCVNGTSDASLICGTTTGRCPEGGLNTTAVQANQNLTIADFGTCEPYLVQPSRSLCDEFIKSTSYVFRVAGSRTQSEIKVELRFVEVNINTADPVCRRQVSSLVCNYFFPPCGSQAGIHLPLSLCQEECNFVSQNCMTTWMAVQNTLRILGRLEAINCSDTFSRFRGLSACCSAVGISIPAMIDCGSLPDPVNGMVDLSGGTLFGVVSQCSCLAGFQLNGVSSRMCTMNGTWSDSAPTCQDQGVHQLVM